MRKRIQRRNVILVATPLVALGLLAGCGNTSDDEPSDGTTAVTGTTGTTAVTGMTGTTGSASPGKGGGNGKDGKPNRKRSRNPASAGDKRGPAPDDAISDRPGGPDSSRPPRANPSDPG